MRHAIDQTPHANRAGMSPAAWCVHSILTSPGARQRGVSTAQEHVLRCCAKVLREADREHLAKLGHADALDRHCRIQAQLEQDGADAAWAEELQRRKDAAREAVADYTGEGA
jgi:hypothetical protein